MIAVCQLSVLCPSGPVGEPVNIFGSPYPVSVNAFHICCLGDNRPSASTVGDILGERVGFLYSVCMQ